MEHLTLETFKSKVFDYTKSREWKFAGALPCIIDFYADWCGPCQMLVPVMEKIAAEYAGRIDVYKVDTEKERELASLFAISSIPSILFVPKDGQPQMIAGALPRQLIVQSIKDVLGIE